MKAESRRSPTDAKRILLGILIVAVLPLLSGAAALSHELLWTRRLVDLLGATDWVIGRVLGLFFLGISLGGYLAHRFRVSQTAALTRLGITELLIALLALPAAFLPAWTDWIWPTIGPLALVSWQGTLIKFVLAGIVVLPPAVAMGFTLPLFVKAATNLGGSVSSVGIWTYSLNTLGGVFGLWLTSTYLVESLGAQFSMLAVAALNLAIAVIAILVARALPFASTEDSPESSVVANVDVAKNKEHSSWQLSQFQLIVLSFFSGAIVLSLEILILRLIALVVPTSYHTTSALLANVILILAISSISVSLFNRFARPSPWLIVFGLATSAVFCCFCPMILFHQTDQLISLRFLQGLNGRTIESINHYWVLVFWLVASASGLAILFCGVVFPGLLSLTSANDPAGDRIGLLLAVNGVGGLLGSEFTNSVLIPVIGIYNGFLLLAAIIALIVSAVISQFSRQLAIGVGMALTLVVFFGYFSVAELPYISPRSKTKFQVETTKFGPEGVLLVVNDDKQSKSILMNNQYVLGSSGVATDERRQLLLPWLIHPEADSVCSLGLATGISASGLEFLQDPPAITAVELSANVAKLAEDYFQDEVRGFFDRSSNEVLIEDARVYITSTRDKYDLIVADLFRPHGTGEGRLYSKEHFANVRHALTEDGLFCQWLPLYQLNQTDFETIAATFQSEFPNTLLVFGNADPNVPVLGLLAWKNDREWSPDLLAKRLQSVQPEIIENDGLLKNAPGLVVGQLKRNVFPEPTINTLDNLAVEISAGNFWILKDLRRDRLDSEESSFLSGRRLAGFINQLDRMTVPIFSIEDRRPILKRLLGSLGS